MRHIRLQGLTARLLLICLLLFLREAVSCASNLDTIGVTLLRATTTNLNGSGIKVMQAEANADSSSPSPFEVNPATIGLPASRFTYFTGPPDFTNAASSGTFPNSIGAESGHADSVGGFFFGPTNGVSTNVIAIDNYDGDYFFLDAVPGLIAIGDPVVNQSFVASGSSVSQQQTYDSNYDNYIAQYGTLIVSGVGNGGAVNPPATCYNGIGVGAYGGGSSVGPTPDNGRAKPDVVAPADETSYSTPLVSGAATILLQAGVRGDGGTDTNSATNVRTLKALILNGAIKAAGWTNLSPSPLDTRYGSGVLNVFDSYKQLAGGKHVYIESGSVSAGNPHPPLGSPQNVSGLSGWDLNTNTSGALTDGVNHYYFNLQTNTANANYTATATLVWNRQAHQTAINNLDLFLYSTATSSLIGASTSLVDNVEHIYIPQLPAGRYDLQVLKHGGANVSSSETYALAFEFFAQSLSISRSGGSVALTWPVYPAGFQLQSTASLTAPVNWSAVSGVPLVTNQQNYLSYPSSTGNQFFRLSR